ncbi:MAG: L-rhamnose mutarotase [Clostridia bacterium]|nr:L-rhamnose mutarotase [Clostridia bacterium]
MKRFGDVIRVPADKYAEYVEKHNNIWPSIVEMMRDAHIQNFTIFHRDGYLFKYYEYTGDDYEADMAKLNANEEHQKWLEYTAVCQQPVDSAEDGEWWAPMNDIFHIL